MPSNSKKIRNVLSEASKNTIISMDLTKNTSSNDNNYDIIQQILENVKIIKKQVKILESNVHVLKLKMAEASKKKQKQKIRIQVPATNIAMMNEVKRNIKHRPPIPNALLKTVIEKYDQKIKLSEDQSYKRKSSKNKKLISSSFKIDNNAFPPSRVITVAEKVARPQHMMNKSVHFKGA
ncbi:uncharacterized protein LOC119679092 [Teleopsis dalmanni]|uniref:uncharacterized protein LOC119679092 n=1 Tax=Teleopsis dalmanni TaxID=139649 RepID=UPI0018CE04D8|nr:uncharacterized protein LOC119679092 [Teleopsis dalmanni]